MPSRRTFLQLALGAPLASALVGCGDNSGGPLAGTFEVSDSGALVWMLSDVPGAIDVEVTDEDRCETTTLAASAAVIGASQTLVLDDLRPATEYSYRVRVAGGPARRFRFRTAPAPAAAAPLRLVVSADIDLAFDLGGLAAIADRDPDVYINLGDWPYADEPPAAVSLDEYRARHRAVREPEPIQRFLAQVPVRAIYDDHDVQCNWDGAFRSSQPERLGAALAAWDEFFPLRDSSRRFRSWRHGTTAEMFLLDTRLYRSANDMDDGPTKTILGAEQLAWLQDGLTASSATFKIVLSSVPLAFATGEDHWSSFADERDRLLAFIEQVDNVVFLSADRHYFEAHHFASGLREFHVGPLAAGPGRPPQEPAPERVGTANTRNFGEVEIDEGASALTFTARDASGRELYREIIDAG